MRSRNQRSWLMTTAQPAKFSSASSSARSVSTSRSLVGSSSSSRLLPFFSSFARWTRLRSPPDSVPTFRCCVAALEVEPRHVGARRDLALAQLDLVVAAGDLLAHGLVRVERLAALVDVADLHRLADPQRARVRLLLSGDHPEQRRLAGAVRADHADDAAARQREVEVRRSAGCRRSPSSRRALRRRCRRAADRARCRFRRSRSSATVSSRSRSS